MAKQTTKSTKHYRVLIPVANDETGKRYQVGDTVTVDDFSHGQIEAWVARQVLQDNDIYLSSLPMESE